MAISCCIKTAKNKIRPASKIARNLGIEVVSVKQDILGNSMGKVIVLNKDSTFKPFIVISENLSLEEKRLTLTHELAHVFLGHLLSHEDSRFKISKEQAEFEAEALGFILYNFLYGIDGGRKSLA